MVEVTITHASSPSQGRSLQGWEYFWTMYVNGFDPQFHCQKGLLGTKSTRLSLKNYREGHVVTLDESRDVDRIYICGGARGWVWKDNLHIALRADKSAEAFEVATYNNYMVKVEGAVRIPIVMAPAGHLGMGRAYTSCRNWCYGIQQFGDQGTTGR